MVCGASNCSRRWKRPPQAERVPLESLAVEVAVAEEGIGAAEGGGGGVELVKWSMRQRRSLFSLAERESIRSL